MTQTTVLPLYLKLSVAWVCFDVLLVKLFSPLSTRNYSIVSTAEKNKNKNKTTHNKMKRESADRLGLTPFYGGIKLRNTVKACFLSAVRFLLFLPGSIPALAPRLPAQPTHTSTHAGLAASHQGPLLHQVPEPSFVALAQALWADLCYTMGHKYVFM